MLLLGVMPFVGRKYSRLVVQNISITDVQREPAPGLGGWTQYDPELNHSTQRMKKGIHIGMHNA